MPLATSKDPDNLPSLESGRTSGVYVGPDGALYVRFAPGSAPTFGDASTAKQDEQIARLENILDAVGPSRSERVTHAVVTLSSSWQEVATLAIPVGARSITVWITFTRAAGDSSSAFKTRVLTGNGTVAGQQTVVDGDLSVGGSLPSAAVQPAYPFELQWPAPETDDPTTLVMTYEPRGGETSFLLEAKSFGGGGNGTITTQVCHQNY